MHVNKSLLFQFNCNKLLLSPMEESFFGIFIVLLPILGHLLLKLLVAPGVAERHDVFKKKLHFLRHRIEVLLELALVHLLASVGQELQVQSAVLLVEPLPEVFIW